MSAPITVYYIKINIFLSIQGPHLSILAGELRPGTAWCSNESHAAMRIYCHVYLHQYIEYLEVDPQTCIR